MSQNLYDQGSRYLVGLDAVGFFHWLLGLQAEDFSFRGWIDTRAISFPGERDLISDMVAHLLNLLEHGVPWALLLEFQIVPDPEMFGRVLRHLGSKWIVLADAEPDTKRRGDYAGIALLFAERTGRKDLWGDKLKGWNVTESAYINEFIAKGEAKGRAEGEAKGRAEEARSMVLRLGAKRFGPIPDSIETAVHAISDHEHLKRISERILDAVDWNDLLATP